MSYSFLSSSTPAGGGGVASKGAAVPPSAAAPLSSSALVHIRQDEFRRMGDEMKLMRRKFKYIQGVSTVFRQKIAFILRELSTGPRDISAEEMAVAYARALRELGQLGTELSVSVLGRDEDIMGRGPAVPVTAIDPSSHHHEHGAGEGGGGGDAMSFKDLLDRMESFQEQLQSNATHQQGIGGATHAMGLEDRAAQWNSNTQAREDIRKAHHLCVLLDEKNAAKAKVSEVQQKLTHLQGQHAALGEKYQRLVQLLQQRGGGGGSSADNATIERELYEQRISALEDALVAARTELGTAHLKQQRGGGAADENSAALVTSSSAAAIGASADWADPSTAAGGLLSVTNTSDVRVLQKQNAVLRSRVQSLRQEVSTLKERGGGTVEEMQSGIDGLFDRIRLLQLDLADRNAKVQQLTAESADNTAAVEASKGHVQAYIDQLSHVNNEHQQLATAYAQLRSVAATETKELSVVVSEYTEMVAQRDAYIQQLQSHLTDEQRMAREREVNISVLGAQIESLRSRIDMMVAAEEGKRLQATSLEDMGDRMVSTLADMQTLYTSGSIAGQLETLGARMGDLEGMETQVRIKDDHIAVLQDECDRLRASHHELTVSLNSVTALFSSMPKSAAELEALVVELEASRAEMARCAAAQCPPDLRRLGQQIDLQLMEARHKKKGALITQGKAASTTRAVANDVTAQYSRPPFPPVPQQQHAGRGGAASLAVDSLLGDEEDVPVEASLLTIPPPPTLVSITDSIAKAEGGGTGAGPSPATSAAIAASPYAKAHKAMAQQPVPTNTSTTSAPASRSASAQHSAPPKASNATSSDLVEDVHMTFDLFAEMDDATRQLVIGGDGITMAYSTLGVARGNPKALRNVMSTRMDRDAFVMHCVDVLGM